MSHSKRKEAAKPLKRFEKEALMRFKEKVMARFRKRINALILFGSKARGDYHSESDMDVLILVKKNNPQTEDKIVDLACEVEEEFDYRLRLAPKIWDQKFFNQLLRHERRIAFDIQNEGIKL